MIEYPPRPITHSQTRVHTSPLLQLHRDAGARLTAPEQGSRLLTYGDVPGEYRAATEGTVLFDRTERGLIAVSGADATAFLHRLLANEVRGLPPGTGCRNLLLTPKGKILGDFDMLPSVSGFELSTPPSEAANLVQNLDVFLFADAVELEDRSEAHAPLEVTGPGAGAILEDLTGGPPPATHYKSVSLTFEGGPLTVVALPVAGSAGWRLDAGPEGAAALWGALVALGAQPAGLVTSDILRVEAGHAEWGADIDASVYPQEARLEQAFSLDKGCYIGQEVVAKIDTYGGLNKRLCALRVDHDDPLAPGTRLFLEDDGEWRDLGVITSWAYSFVLDTGVVLAYLKRRHQEPGTVFRVGETEARATIVELPVREGAVLGSGS